MNVNIDNPDFFATSIVKYYIGKMGDPTAMSDYLTWVMASRNPSRIWPVVGNTDYTSTAFEAGKDDIIARINEYLREVRKANEVAPTLSSAANDPFALIASKRAGHEGTDKISYLNVLGKPYNKKLKFGFTLSCDPFEIQGDFQPKDLPSGTGAADTLLKTRAERLQQSKDWIDACWMWDYETAIRNGFFTKKDPETPADLAGAARQRRGTAWCVQCLNVYAHEVVHATEAPIIISAMNFLKQEHIWRRIDVTLRKEIDEHYVEYKPMAPAVMDWGHMLPREIEGWNGKGMFYPCAPTWGEAFKLFDDSTLIDRPINLAYAMAEYLQEYVTWQRNTDQAGTRSTVLSCFGFHSVAEAHTLSVWGTGIRPIYTTGSTISRADTLYNYFGNIILPQTAHETAPIWADPSIRAQVLFSDALDIDGSRIWLPVERTTRDKSFPAAGSILCYRSVNWYAGAEGSVIKPNDFTRMALHFVEKTESEFADELLKHWDLLMGKLVIPPGDPKPMCFGSWTGVTFESKTYSGKTKPKDVEDMKSGKWTGAVYLALEFAHPDAVAILYSAAQPEGTTLPAPFVGVTSIREGLATGVSGPSRNPRTAYRVEPGLEPCTYASSAMVTNWLSALGA